MSINFGLVVGEVKLYFEVLSVAIKSATKAAENGVAACYRNCRNKETGARFIALNAADQYGRRIDIEISDPSGFPDEHGKCEPLIDLDSGLDMAFTPPTIGSRVKIINGSVKRADYAGMVKWCVNIESARQLEVNPIVSAAVNAPTVSAKKKRGRAV